MIIDLILDRRQGTNTFYKNGKLCTTPIYNAKRFYESVMDYYDTFPEIVGPIAEALDNGEERDIKRELCDYIDRNGYDLEIRIYVNSVNWL